MFPGAPRYEDDGATLLLLGTIRPYKQLDHAIEVARRCGARLLVVGDPTFDLGARLRLPGVEWRLGYANDTQIDAALAETTVALFPYREELDQSGALLRALGAGVAVAAYDVGGIAEPVSRFGAGQWWRRTTSARSRTRSASFSAIRPRSTGHATVPARPALR